LPLPSSRVIALDFYHILCYITRMNNNWKKIILFLGDIFILYLALYFTLLIRYGQGLDYGDWHNHFGPFTVIFAAWLIIFYISDLYNLYLAVSNSRFFYLSARAILIAGLTATAFFYLNPGIGIAPKTNLLIYIFVFFLLFFAWRRIFNWLLNSRLPKNNIAVVGYNAQVAELIATLRENPHLGYRFALIVEKNGVRDINPIPVVSDMNRLRDAIINSHISTIVLASDPHQSPQLRASLFSCLPLKIRFVNLPNFYEQVTGKVPIEAINQMWFLENLDESSKKLFDIFKRLFDLAVSSLLLCVSLPFWLVIGLLLKIENKEPVFFSQTRAGKNGKAFRMIKFRTQKTIAANPAPASHNDARNTKIGSFIRKTRIDEIPGVLNVLAGDMSFVGPRPERPELITGLEKEIPFYRERMLVKPGLTGPDQVSGEYHSPSREDTLKKLQYDLYYIKNRSLYLDLTIILKTIAAVLRGGGV